MKLKELMKYENFFEGEKLSFKEVLDDFLQTLKFYENNSLIPKKDSEKIDTLKSMIIHLIENEKLREEGIKYETV